MLVCNDKNRRFDRLVILPAIFIICNTVPWIIARVRMFLLLPLIALYFILVCARQQKTVFVSARERNAGFFALLGLAVFFLSYFLASSWVYGGVNYGWLSVAIFAFFTFWVFIRLVAENKVREIKVLALVALGAIFVAAVMGAFFLGDEMNQDVLRNATGGLASDEEVMAAREAGVGGFHNTYAVGLLAIPILYAGFRVKGKLKFLFWTVSFFSVVYAYRAGFSILMTTIWFGMMLCLWAIVIKKFGYFRCVAVAGLVLLLFLTLYPTIFSFASKPFAALAEMTENPNYSMRLTSIAEALDGNLDEYAVKRTRLLWVSWYKFLENPVFGINPDSARLIGGHSFIFDYLAIGGLFFFLPFPFFFYYYTKYLKVVIYPLSPNSRYLIETYFYMYIMCTLLNPLSATLVWTGFFLVLPGLSLFFSDSMLNQKNRRRGNTVRTSIFMRQY